MSSAGPSTTIESARTQAAHAVADDTAARPRRADVPRVILSLPDLRERKSVPPARPQPTVQVAPPAPETPTTLPYSAPSHVMPPVATFAAAGASAPINSSTAPATTRPRAPIAIAAHTRPAPQREPKLQPGPTVASPVKPAVEAQRHVRFDGLGEQLQPVLRGAFSALKSGRPLWTKLTELLASRNVWYVIAAALLADVIIVYQLSKRPGDADPLPASETTASHAELPTPQPAAPRGETPGSLPTPTSMPELTLPAPMAVPTITPVSPAYPAGSSATPSQRSFVPSPSTRPGPATLPSPAPLPGNAPRLSPPNDLPAWDSWPPKGAALQSPGIRESTANTPARLSTGDAEESMPTVTMPPLRTARVPERTALPSTESKGLPDTGSSEAGSPETGKVKLLGVIRKTPSGSEHERARSGLY